MWAVHNFSEDKQGDIVIWENRVAPPCHHGREKVQDDDGRVKTGASDGWKEFMKAPTEVR